MKKWIILLMVTLSFNSFAEELIVHVAGLPEKAVLLGKNRQLIPSVYYRILEDKIVFTGKKSDIEFLKSSVAQRTLLPFFSDAYQDLTPVKYTVTFQVKDPIYLLNLSLALNCGFSTLRHSQCGNFNYYTALYCRLSPDKLLEMERSLKVTSSLEDAKQLKIMADNPCINPRMESLYEFAIKMLAHKIGIGDESVHNDFIFEAYQVTERALEIL